MKRCTTCNRTFDEEWLAFCTDDGSTLIETTSAPLSNDPPPTVFIPPAVSTDPARRSRLICRAVITRPNQLPPVWRPPPPPPMRQGTGQKQGLAVATLILGIFSITIGWCCSLGLLSAPVGIVLGIISLVQIKNDPVTNTGKPLSIIGLCLSGFILWSGS